MPKHLQKKTYLGDGVYAGHDGFQVWVTTENGVETTNEIALESQVLKALILYVKELGLHPDG